MIVKLRLAASELRIPHFGWARSEREFCDSIKDDACYKPKENT